MQNVYIREIGKNDLILLFFVAVVDESIPIIIVGVLLCWRSFIFQS